NGDEGVLTYKWTVTGPAQVTLTADGTNAAKNAIAAFTAIGTYQFQARITDTVTHYAVDTDMLSVVVNPGVNSVVITNKTATLNAAQSWPFIAVVYDQFGQLYNTPVSWSASAGVMSASGQYTAPNANQTVLITATAQGKSDSANVTVVVVGAGSGGDLSNAKAFPVPWKAVSGGDPNIHFKGLVDGTRIRLFAITGRLVTTLNSPSGCSGASCD